MSGVRNRIPGVVYMPAEARDDYIRKGILSDQSLIAAFRESFKRNAQRVAISEPGHEVRYAELDEITDRGAAALHALGLRMGDRVLFQVKNCKEVFYAFFSCLKMGAIPICTLAAHRSLEIGYLGRHGEAKAHFVHADNTRFDMVEFARAMRKEIPTLRHILTLRGEDGEEVDSFEHLIAQQDPEAARRFVETINHDPFQVVLFQLSGGTSGVPKIIPRFSNEYRYTVQSVIDWLGLGPDVVAFTPNPLMHNAPMSCFWAPALFLGGEVAVAASPGIGDIEATLAARRPTWSILAKVHMLGLKESGATDRLKFDDVVGFAVMDNAGLLGEMMRAPCLPIFGMTEGLLAFAQPGDPREVIETTVGRPTSSHDELRLVEPGTEKDVGDGATGELLVRGPCTIAGYYNAPERNAEAFTSDGFYRSGDLMRFKTVGGERQMVFEGRVKDVVDRGGEKINCSEVENLLLLHPDVGTIACVAMPDPKYGERMCAFVVVREGAPRVTVADLGAFLNAKGLAKYKYPERVEIVDELPTTSSGKPSKPLMRERIAARLAKERSDTSVARA